MTNREWAGGSGEGGLLTSMTGYGEAQRRQKGLAVAVEVRTINSRFFKLSVRATEGFNALEPKVEELVRRRIRRGTIQVNLRIDRVASPDDYRIDAQVLAGYLRQLDTLRREHDLPGPASLEALLPLPGVVQDCSAECGGRDDAWPLVAETIEAALDHLARMREEEGRAMAADLAANGRLIAAELEKIARRAPAVVEAYRARLEERMRKALAEFEIALDPADLLKEVSLFADRGDVSEEIVRMRSHLEQFEATLALPESSGRKLEFLAQELFREANTIGSKAGDVEITRGVIEMKAAIERIREMIQNVE
jgi:uncharacterized protein (TIGR00255 family)